ncbi:MAG: ACT domain-containing protein, partial [Chloroflexi bacterium]|nr:ACT domain-containing protein [Chloroflexota bacterium]
MLTLHLLPDIYAIWQLPAQAETPPIPAGRFHCVIRTPDELSGVCPADLVPAYATVDDNWRCLQFIGPFDLTLTGIMVQVAQPLAKAGVPIFTLATYNTDYILIPNARLNDALAALHQAAITVHAVAPHN